jgi:DNA-binding transcriptional ArsR family regulator
MKTGPNIALIASLVGDPARANMLTALMSGRALTASELAHEAGVTLQTASSHLAKLHDGGLVTPEKQGRHRYFRLSGEDVAVVLESLMGLAARVGHLRVRTGPRDPAMRQARICYDHLAGDLGVQLFDSLTSRGLIAYHDAMLRPTRKGERFFAEFGIDLGELGRRRRALCKPCLDWSARRSHLAGALGAALLDRFYDLKWAQRERETRVVTFSLRGRAQFHAMFGPPSEMA